MAFLPLFCWLNSPLWINKLYVLYQIQLSTWHGVNFTHSDCNLHCKFLIQWDRIDNQHSANWILALLVDYYDHKQQKFKGSSEDSSRMMWYFSRTRTLLAREKRERRVKRKIGRCRGTERLRQRQSEEGVTLIPEWEGKKVTETCTHTHTHTHTLAPHIWSIQFL